MNEITVKLGAKLKEGYKFYCECCGCDDDTEEFEKFLDFVYDKKNGLVLDEVFVTDNFCEKCGSNTFHFIGNIEITYE